MALTPQEQEQLQFLNQTMGPSSVQAPEGSLQGDMAAIQAAIPPPLSEQVLQGIQDYSPMASELVGGVIGAFQLGKYMPVPAPLKVPAGAVVGAMSGRLFGETVADVAGDEVDIIDTLQNTAEAGLYAALGEGAGALIGKGINAIRNYRAGTQLTATQLDDLQKLQEALQRTGVKDSNGNLITLTPAQIANSPFQTNLERFALSGFGGGRISEMYKAQNEALQLLFEQNVRKYGTATREEAGQAFIDALKQAEDELIKFAAPKYAAIDTAAKGQRLNSASVQEWARQKLVANAQNLRGGAKNGSIAELLSSPSRLPKDEFKLYADILKNKQSVTFADMFSDIQTMTTKLRELKATVGTPQKDLIAKYSAAIERYHLMLDKQAAKMGTDVYNEYKNISTLYREGMSNLRSDAVIGLVTKAPEKVGETIWANGNVSMVKDAFKAIDDAAKLSTSTGGKGINAEAIKQNLKAGYLDNLFKQVQADMSDSAADKASAIFGKIKADPKVRDTFMAVLSKQEQSDISRVLGWAEALEKQSAGNFSLVVRGKQSQGLNKIVQSLQGIAGAGSAVAYGAGANPVGAIATGIALVSSPAMLARWATSGKASSKMLGTVTDIVRRSAQGKVDPVQDLIALSTVMASMPLRNDDIPADMRVKGLSANEAMEMHFLEIVNQNIAPK